MASQIDIHLSRSLEVHQQNCLSVRPGFTSLVQGKCSIPQPECTSTLHTLPTSVSPYGPSAVLPARRQMWCHLHSRFPILL